MYLDQIIYIVSFSKIFSHRKPLPEKFARNTWRIQQQWSICSFSSLQVFQFLVGIMMEARKWRQFHYFLKITEIIIVNVGNTWKCNWTNVGSIPVLVIFIKYFLRIKELKNKINSCAIATKGLITHQVGAEYSTWLLMLWHDSWASPQLQLKAFC